MAGQTTEPPEIIDPSQCSETAVFRGILDAHLPCLDAVKSPKSHLQNGVSVKQRPITIS